MNLKSLWQLTKGRWREFRREPSAFFFVIFMPVLWMMILGLAFHDQKPETYQVFFASPLVEGGEGAFVKKVRSSLQESPQVKLWEETEPISVDQILRDKKTHLVVSVLGKEVRYHYDHKQPLSKEAHKYVDERIQQSFGRQNPVLTRSSLVQTPGSRYIDFLIPGLLALSIFTSSLYGTGMSLVVNRRENLLKRYRATPMNPLLFFSSYVIGRYLILAVEIFTVLVSGYVMFQFAPQGSLFDLVLFCLLGASSFTVLAILCGSRLKNASAYNGLANILVLIAMLLGGVWFARSGFPPWLSHLSDFLPLTPLVEGLRKISLEGAHLRDLTFEIGVLSLYLVITTLWSKKVFRWY